MAKAFSEREKKIIQQNLISNCNECWSKYGYSRTSIREICSNIGISIGAFYIFYKSKEALFLETASKFQNDLVDMVSKDLSKNTTKGNFIEVFKKMCKEIQKTPWLIDFDAIDYELFLRKLPEEDMNRLFEQNKRDITSVLNKVNLKLKCTEDEFNAVVHMLLISLLNKDKIGIEFDNAFNIVVNLCFESLFE